MTVQTVYIELTRGADSAWRVRQKYTNGNILSTSPKYATHWSAKRAANRLAKLTGFEIRG